MKNLPLLICFAFLASACGQDTTVTPAESAGQTVRPTVVASNYPLYFFTREISGGSVNVVLPDIQGDPAQWRPGPNDIELLQRADRILLNGAGYESWLNWVSLPVDRLVDTTASFRHRLSPLEQETVHQHGPGGEHSHSGTAFTVWLDPELAIDQANSIENAISQLTPNSRARHRENLIKLQERLKDLHREQMQVFEPLSNQPILFSHPVYQYLEARYGLDGYSLHWEPDQPPVNSAWIDFANIHSDHPAQVMIWEDAPLPDTLDRLAQLGVTSIPYHTASNLPANGDYFDVMNSNLSRIRAVVSLLKD